METKEQSLERVLGYDRPRCPDCGELMSVWEAPIQGLEDGGGWGTPYLFVCFSDTCPSFVNGRVYYRTDRPGTRAFCRRMYYPGNSTCESICFLSAQGGKGQIVNEMDYRKKLLLNIYRPEPIHNPVKARKVREKVREIFEHWGEFPGYPISDWVAAVQAEHTRLGYWDWISIVSLEEYLEKYHS